MRVDRIDRRTVALKRKDLKGVKVNLPALRRSARAKAHPARSRSIGEKPGASPAPLAARLCQTRTGRSNSGETLRDTSPFVEVWTEAVAGEAVINVSFTATARSIIRPVRSCVRCWCILGGHAARMAANLRPVGRSERSSLNFDNLARPIKRRINHSAVAALPISFRPALLVGVSRAIVNPAILKAVRDETILRGRRAFERLCETAVSKLKA